ncbi:Hin recombinase [Clostridium neonatale]|uniref:Uncharacterized protein n=1 Tax=Clostridium neonatale TaxID=137838 RepID=A0AAD1YLE3_9CLOT|nr:Hin recombinase [Clostridium neonatale]MBP8312807.1 Hin recombinase [Clostridium neonatale]CAI3195276.1 conserved hypothetical protein [Clostridium neonatale]CAI3214064.1 conserved hypothetical protein [Clostridium neonatale]CAI3216180.1 conserved hypothetical protein [Clostridium neonatale]CAI3216704.1 conserved hypothetical protein [Clostridium neonatale]
MARETQKAKIERLEKELEQKEEIIKELLRKELQKDEELKKAERKYQDLIKACNKDIQKLKDENERLKKKRERKANENNLELIDQQLQDARDKADKWHRQLFIQQQKNKELEKEIEYLVEKNSIIQKHNERGAGRKSRFTQSEIETIKMYRLQGKTIKEIAKMFKCSVGLIHKIINEK